MSYPPEPWRLRGRMYLSVWLVPRAETPGPLPPGTRPVALGGRCLVGTAVVRYGEGGMLRYDELLRAVLVRRGARLMPSITDIWVDSPVSRDGGRELWGIPKEPADFTTTPPPGTAPGLDAEVRAEGRLVAAARFRDRVHLPARLPLLYHVVQTLRGARKETPVRLRARPGVCRAFWRIPPHGPLGSLTGRRPLLNLLLRDFVLVFGTPDTPAAGRRM